MDVPAALLLLALVGGFLFLDRCRYTRFSAAREDGHRLYFKAAFWGAVLLVIVGGLLGVLNWVASWVPHLSAMRSWLIAIVTPLLKDPSTAPAQTALLVAAISTMLAGWPVALLANRLGQRRGETSEEADGRVLAKTLENDGVEMILLDAALLAQQVMITLASGKVYVGIPLGNPDVKRDRKAVTLLPVMSGYRDESHRVHFTTFYDEQLRSDSFDEDDFRLVIPLDKCVSLQKFDLETYAAFQDRAAGEGQASETTA